MDWRLNHLGRLDTAAALMFNKLEAMWFNTPFYAKNYVMCDQVRMVMVFATFRDHIFFQHQSSVAR